MDVLKASRVPANVFRPAFRYKRIACWKNCIAHAAASERVEGAMRSRREILAGVSILASSAQITEARATDASDAKRRNLPIEEVMKSIEVRK